LHVPVPCFPVRPDSCSEDLELENVGQEYIDGPFLFDATSPATIKTGGRKLLILKGLSIPQADLQFAAFAFSLLPFEPLPVNSVPLTIKPCSRIFRLVFEGKQ
jgi:hypothetical protein